LNPYGSRKNCKCEEGNVRFNIRDKKITDAKVITAKPKEG